jgi:nesprin-1
LRTSSLPSDSFRQNDTEKVGELCEKSHKVSLYITEELELADLCKGRLNTLRQEIGNIRENQIDFYENLSAFEGATKLECAAIEKALVDCHTMRENLITHWQDIMRVRHLLHTLPTGLRMSVSPVDVEKEISLLEDDYVDIEKRLCDVENLLKSRFSLWKRFENQLETIQQSINDTDYMVELLTVHGNIDYDRLLKATEKLEVRRRFKLLRSHFLQFHFQ